MKELTIDTVISQYVGKVTTDKERILKAPVYSAGIPRHVYEEELRRDEMILGALKCAKAHGFSGEA